MRLRVTFAVGLVAAATVFLSASGAQSRALDC
jgi:hypothetical protein